MTVSRSGRALRIIASVCWCTAVAAGAATSDLVHITDEELRAELARRGEDIARTQERIQNAKAEKQQLVALLERTRERETAIEQLVAGKIRLFYKASRRGDALRFLLGSQSPKQLLLRVRTLRSLLIEGLEARRQAGLRVAETEDRLRRADSESDAAERMLEMLSTTLAELEAEKRRRAGPLAGSIRY